MKSYTVIVPGRCRRPTKLVFEKWTSHRPSLFTNQSSVRTSYRVTCPRGLTAKMLKGLMFQINDSQADKLMAKVEQCEVLYTRDGNTVFEVSTSFCNEDGSPCGVVYIY